MLTRSFHILQSRLVSILTLSPLTLRGKLRFTRTLNLGTVFLLIEFFDELHYGVQGAALPAIRSELSLSYAQIGLLLGAPHLISSLIEPVILLLGDTSLRHRLIIFGGGTILLTLLVTASAQAFPLLLAAWIIAYPASGAFVSLSQATLVDMVPGREAQSMARWTVMGSIGNLLGPLAIAAGFSLGMSWRTSYSFLAALVLPLILALLFKPFFANRSIMQDTKITCKSLRALISGFWQAVRQPRILRWIFLLQSSDLLLDVFYGYVPLYLVDVITLTPAQASLALAALMVAGLVADLVLIPLLEHFSGRRVLRLSAAAAFVLYLAWLIVPWTTLKLGLLVLIPFSTLGWYSILSGEAYAELPGRSGTVSALSSLGSLLGGVLVWSIGWVAAQVGLSSAMVLLLAGPLSLVLFLPADRDSKRQSETQ